jgi:hypothetical protein
LEIGRSRIFSEEQTSALVLYFAHRDLIALLFYKQVLLELFIFSLLKIW